MTRVLFISSNFEDYLADGVFHGLRTLLGADAVDFPKSEYLYASASRSTLGRVRGGGFTLYGLLPDLEIDRTHLFPRAMEGEFDAVVFGDIRRSFGYWVEWAPQLHRAGIPLVVLDGTDRPEPYPYSRRWWKVPGWWFLPRAHNRATYFKREITPWTRWAASYLLLPPPIGRTLGLRPTAFSIPEEKIVAEASPKKRDFASHIVDPEVAARVGGSVDHAFVSEENYYEDLQQSRFGVTTKRAGWDALRHYEIAANASVPCFRDLARKPVGCAPHGLGAANALSYTSADDLLSQITRLSAGRYQELQGGALDWVKNNTTRVRAATVLEAIVP